MKEKYYKEVKVRLPANIYFGKDKKPTNMKIVSICGDTSNDLGLSFVVENIDTGETMSVSVAYWPDGWHFK